MNTYSDSDADDDEDTENENVANPKIQLPWENQTLEVVRELVTEPVDTQRTCSHFHVATHTLVAT